ncbi:MAG: hypothetical protein HOC20_12300 [Chloroflexi bacterium]|jgi:archaeal flagellin FlaB|nr:hypothetical protein [Chloroflexota bacterium]
MLNRFLNRMNESQKGITGLETAIILIAFVVVAAVFAYTVLSAGLFSSQKSSEAVYAGLEEAQSTMQLDGAVMGFASTAGADLEWVKFTLSNALDGEAINFTEPTYQSSGTASNSSNSVIVVSYVDKNQRIDDLYWSYKVVGDDDGDNLLEGGEKFQMTIPGSVTDTSDFTSLLTDDISANHEFTIEIKPAAGAVMKINRTTPAYIDKVMNLN